MHKWRGIFEPIEANFRRNTLCISRKFNEERRKKPRQLGVLSFLKQALVSCNYKDGTKTVNFSEMESALTLRASVSGSDLDCSGAPKSRGFKGLCFFILCD